MDLQQQLERLTLRMDELAQREEGWLQGMGKLVQRVEALEANKVWEQGHFTGSLQAFVFDVCSRLRDLESRLPLAGVLLPDDEGKVSFRINLGSRGE